MRINSRLWLLSTISTSPSPYRLAQRTCGGPRRALGLPGRGIVHGEMYQKAVPGTFAYSGEGYNYLAKVERSPWLVYTLTFFFI